MLGPMHQSMLKNIMEKPCMKQPDTTTSGIKRVVLGDLSLYTSDQFDGYGYQHINDILGHIVGMSGNKPVKRALEAFCGPGYIGFGLKELNYAEEIVLSDIHEPLWEAIGQSINVNNLQDSVQFIVSDNFKNIPEQKFDLIVGNPPHFNFRKLYDEKDLFYNEPRKHVDLDWKIHIDFYNNVKNYLAPDGKIILMENVRGSDPHAFEDMINKNGLRMTDYAISETWPDDIWYIKVEHE
jgi:methylase of polypeptide subunit release factors